MHSIIIEGAREHNLKNINLEIPKNKLVVVTGLSGSGKSSLAFDTIYVEGQRRYIESLSSYVRQFLHLYDKPDVDRIIGISPTIAINQKSIAKNNRSTVATVTEIYDYLRVLFARIGLPHSPESGMPIKKYTPTQIANQIFGLPKDYKLLILSPMTGKSIEHYISMGYTRFKIDGEIIESGDLNCNINNNLNNKQNDSDISNDEHKIPNSVIIDRVITGREGIEERIISSVENALKLSGGYIYIEIISPQKSLMKFSEKAECLDTGYSFGEIEPRKFSFNVQSSWCEKCRGIGCENFIDIEKHINHNAPFIDAFSEFAEENNIPYYFLSAAKTILERARVQFTKKWNELTLKQKSDILYGIKAKDDGISRLLTHFADENEDGTHTKIIEKKVCRECNGYRLAKDALFIKINNLHIGNVVEMTIEESLEWFSNLSKALDQQEIAIADLLLKEIISRLGFLQDVGLEYLTLSRDSSTLSGGEAQRIRLASQIGSGLTGVIYVLDEPSIGLHQCDNDKLIAKLKHLRDLNNTVIVVEHDDDTMLQSDYIIDIGPGAGQHGGRVISFGTPGHVIADKHSLTGAYLSGREKIEVRESIRTAERFLKIGGMNANNLQNLEISVPLGTFVCVTGVSGSGKSTLVTDTLYYAVKRYLDVGQKSDLPKFSYIEGMEQIDKIIEIDQSPIGRAPFSNPVTYTGIFDYIRAWFTNLDSAKARGYKIGRFSFNVKGGRCENCRGYGMIKVEMQIIADKWVKCQECNGKRYNRETLEIKYKDKNISDVLNMTVDALFEFFDKIPAIRSRVKTLQEVGLGYLKVGQSSVHLSGGEAQRIKLSKELSKRSTGKTLYILDEPTTGLHMHDVKNLLKILHYLVDLGNTVVVIEHNLHLIKTADYIFDIGPKGGKSGGRIIAQGTPKQIAMNEASVTGKYLKNML